MNDQQIAIANASENLKQKNLVVLLGAGISFDAPASLPVAKELFEPIQRTLIDALDSVNETLDFSSEDYSLCKRLIRDAPLESLLNALQPTYRGRTFRYISNELTGSSFNENHRALALLAKRQLLPTIVTLNFDVLIEKALDKLGVPYRTSCTLSANENPKQEFVECEIVKPHGTLGHSSGGYQFPTNLATTLHDLGQEPHPATIGRLRQIFRERTCLVVAGYGGTDWDIYPIVERFIKNGPLQYMIWINHPGCEMEERVSALFSKLPASKGILIDCHATKFLSEIAGTPLLTIPPPRALKTIDAKSVFGSVHANAFAIVELLGIAGQPEIATRLLRWLLVEMEHDKPWQFLIIRKLGFMQHLAGNSRAYFEMQTRALHCLRDLPEEWQTLCPETNAWHVHACLSLIKPNRIKLKQNPLRWWRLYRHAINSKRRCMTSARRADEHQREVGLANHFFADFWLAWINVLFLLGPRARGIVRVLSRSLLNRVRRSKGYSAEFLSTGYWGLRNLELRILAGQLPNRFEDQRVQYECERLVIRTQFYMSTASRVEAGNGFAYHAFLLAYFNQHEKETFINHCFKRAEEIWRAQKPLCKPGLARIVLFKRFLGRLGFAESLKSIQELRQQPS